MPLIVLKCPNCGGSLEFEESREFGFCNYCGHKLILKEDVTNIYHNTTTINNNTIIQNTEQDRDTVIKAEIRRMIFLGNFYEAYALSSDYLESDSIKAHDPEVLFDIFEIDYLSYTKSVRFVKKDGEIIKMVPIDYLHVLKSFDTYVKYSGDRKTFQSHMSENNWPQIDPVSRIFNTLQITSDRSDIIEYLLGSDEWKKKVDFSPAAWAFHIFSDMTPEQSKQKLMKNIRNLFGNHMGIDVLGYITMNLESVPYAYFIANAAYSTETVIDLRRNRPDYYSGEAIRIERQRWKSKNADKFRKGLMKKFDQDLFNQFDQDTEKLVTIWKDHVDDYLALCKRICSNEEIALEGDLDLNDIRTRYLS